jgi:hypothetical protein
MKLTDVLALVKPFLAVDAKPDEIKAAILAADKAAKDKAKDEAEDPERTNDADPEKDEPKAKDKGAKDKAKDKDMDADDEDVDAEDNELEQAEPSTPSKGGASKKPAVDSAEVDRRIKAAVAARDELHAAQREVEPIIGARTFDRASAAYKAGLEALGVDLEGVPESAYRAVLRLAKDRGTAPAPIAMDSASEAEVLKLIPNYNRL